ncbi:MAG: CSLREA domain-containing protein, partial [Pyrinomonadaceae bacterium]
MRPLSSRAQRGDLALGLATRLLARLRDRFTPRNGPSVDRLVDWRRISKAVAVFILTLAAGRAIAATFTVNSTTDAVDANPGNGVCATSAAVCTLRAAIQEANALAGADTINLPAGTYTLTRTGAGEDAGSTGDLDVTQNLTINGADARTTIIRAGTNTSNGIDRVLDARGSANLTISGTTIRFGNVSGGGGGISNGTGTLTLTDVAINSNTSSGNGGGIYNQNGTLTLSRVTINGNTASSAGGGIYNDNSGNVTLTNVTLSGNTTNGNGGAVYNSNGTVTLT